MKKSLIDIFRKSNKTPIYRNVNSISEKIIDEYNVTRSIHNKNLLCHAPFTNLYFNTEGDVALCWKTFHKAEKYDESKSILDIWNSENFKKIRSNIQDETLDYACHACKKHLTEGNYVNVLSKAYDIEYKSDDFPKIMEFELSNRCNLACTMCNGLLSSTIRKDREHLPPLVSPYGEKFVEDLRPFIPHLQEARFNGGEPFSIKLYYKIWDLIFELNPKLKIVIATNGTILNEKVKYYLERGNFHINLSIDGIQKETYEKIRIKGNFVELMQNFEYFLHYCKTKKRTLCIMINPMRENWQEMPEFVEFCNKNNIHLWFNTIEKPSELALWSLSPDELEIIYSKLSSHTFKNDKWIPSSIQKYNIRTYENFVHTQIKTWLEESKQRETFNLQFEKNTIEELLLLMNHKLNHQMIFEKLINALSYFENDTQKKIFLKSILQTTSEYLKENLQSLQEEEIYTEAKKHLFK